MREAQDLLGQGREGVEMVQLETEGPECAQCVFICVALPTDEGPLRIIFFT